MVQPILNPCDIEAPEPCGENPSFTYTRYPCDYDDPRPSNSRGLPVIVDLQTPVKAEVVNRQREAILAIESELGIQPSGTFTTVRSRLDAFDSFLCSVWQSILNSGNPISVQHNSSVIVNPVTSFNFIGNNIDVQRVNETQANITISVNDGYRPVHENLLVNFEGQATFNLEEIPWSNSLLLFIDGLKQEMGDYEVNGSQLTWIGSQTLNGSDIVEVLYFVESLGGDGGSTVISGECPGVDGYDHIYGVSGEQITNETLGYKTIGAFSLNTAHHSVDTYFVFQAILESTSSSVNAEIRIFNATTGSVMSGTELSTNQTDPTLLEVGFNPNIGENVYLIQFKASSIPDPSDFVSCKNAVILASVIRCSAIDGSGTYFEEATGIVSTSNDVPTDIVSINVNNGSAQNIHAMITAIDTSNSNIGTWVINGAFKNVLGVVSQVGSTAIINSEKEYVGFAATFTVGAGIATVTVTGHPTNIVNWKATIHAVGVP